MHEVCEREEVFSCSSVHMRMAYTHSAPTRCETITALRLTPISTRPTATEATLTTCIILQCHVRF